VESKKKLPQSMPTFLKFGKSGPLIFGSVMVIPLRWLAFIALRCFTLKKILGGGKKLIDLMPVSDRIFAGVGFLH
jgi:hypothetical protein